MHRAAVLLLLPLVLAAPAASESELAIVLGYRGGDASFPIEAEARKLLDDKVAEVPDTLEGKTVVIEFARGCADGQIMPPNGNLIEGREAIQAFWHIGSRGAPAPRGSIS